MEVVIRRFITYNRIKLCHSRDGWIYRMGWMVHLAVLAVSRESVTVALELLASTSASVCI